ncbi:XF1762 family protein [Streptomyces bobili]|uniref:XF1762 family protein n=1 Tax=Streptomyces bobili TaxID=67280 RepID=UPI0033AE34DA
MRRRTSCSPGTAATRRPSDRSSPSAGCPSLRRRRHPRSHPDRQRRCTQRQLAAVRRSWRAAKALGYRRLITFTQEGESGASLRGAGWHLIASRPPRAGWSTPSRTRAGHGNDRVARFLWQAP